MVTQVEKDAAFEALVQFFGGEEMENDGQLVAHILEAAEKARNQPLVRHIKRGTTYSIIGMGELQCADPRGDGTAVTLYRCTDTGELWVRPTDEFIDPNRFEVIR